MSPGNCPEIFLKFVWLDLQTLCKTTS